MTDMLFTAGENNPGGNYLIRFAPVVGILTLPPPAISSPSLPATFRDGFRWFQLYGTESTKTLDEQQQESDNGPVWSVKVVTWLPADSAGLRQQLAGMARHRFVLEIEDNAGLLRRVGTLIENLTLMTEFKTGGPMSDRRGTLLTFSGQLSRPIPILTY